MRDAGCGGLECGLFIETRAVIESGEGCRLSAIGQKELGAIATLASISNVFSLLLHLASSTFC